MPCSPRGTGTCGFCPAGRLFGLPSIVVEPGTAIEPGVDPGNGKIDPPVLPPERGGLAGRFSAWGSCCSGIGGGVGMTMPPIVLESRPSGRGCTGHCRQFVSLNPKVSGLTLHWPLGALVGRIEYDWPNPGVCCIRQSRTAPKTLETRIQGNDFFMMVLGGG